MKRCLRPDMTEKLLTGTLSLNTTNQPSKLLVTRTGIKAWSSSNLGWIRPLILELLALEWQKFHTFELEYLWSQLANIDQILCVASLGCGKGCIRFGSRLTLAHLTQMSNGCPLGYLFPNILKRQWWIFINFCRHIDINKVYLHKKK